MHVKTSKRYGKIQCSLTSSRLLREGRTSDDPNEIRTRMSALRGPYPKPLDDGTVEESVTHTLSLVKRASQEMTVSLVTSGEYTTLDQYEPPTSTRTHHLAFLVKGHQL